MIAAGQGEEAAPGERSASGADAKKDRESGYVPFVTVTPPPSLAGLGIGAAGCAAEGGAPAPLPCLISNNYTKEDQTRLSQGQLRAAYALEENVKLLCKDWGLERLGFLTLTFADHVTDIKEAQRRFNSLRTHVLSVRYPHGISVVERQKSGRIHFHVLVVCAGDIRTGINWHGFKCRDYQSANGCLRSEWAFWRKTAPAYRFGRTELLPIMVSADAIARYVGKYIGKHLSARIPEDKGARLVRYFGESRKVGTRFAWVGIRSWLWRKKLAKFAATQGVFDYGGLNYVLGPRWVWKYEDEITATKLSHYPTLKHALEDGITLVEGDKLSPNGEVFVLKEEAASLRTQLAYLD